MPAIPAIFKMIQESSYATTLRTRLLSRFSSTTGLRSSHSVSRKKPYPDLKNPHEERPYIELFDREIELSSSQPGIKTFRNHVEYLEPPKQAGSTRSMDLDVSSTRAADVDYGKNLV